MTLSMVSLRGRRGVLASVRRREIHVGFAVLVSATQAPAYQIRPQRHFVIDAARRCGDGPSVASAAAYSHVQAPGRATVNKDTRKHGATSSAAIT